MIATPKTLHIVQLFAAGCLFLTVPFVSASCNIDSAGTKTYSTSDGLVITKVGVTATFRLGCDKATAPPKLHAEVDGQYLAVTHSTEKPDFKEVSFVEELEKSKSRWVEIKVYDDDTYQKLIKARESGSRESSYTPLKTISVSHYGVSKGPTIKTETFATVALIGSFIYAYLLKSKIAH